MLIYISGGSGSGKSEFAEELITKSEIKERAYIATMRVFDPDGEKRVERHRQLRAGKGFKTFECPTSLLKLDETGGAVLLEDLTNLFMNEWFENGAKGAVSRVCEGIKKLALSAGLFVIVGNDIFSDGCDYGAEMGEYLCAQGEVNCFAASIADEVYEVVCSVPMKLSVRKFGGEGMTLVIGGAYQGKLDYALRALNTDVSQVGHSPSECLDRRIFANLHDWLRQSASPWEELHELLEKNPGITIICDEVGCGVVPMGEKEREWRERVGRVSCELASRADIVVRLHCGIPAVLKGGGL